jgi:molybdate transport system ATP-binding protein
MNAALDLRVDLVVHRGAFTLRGSLHARPGETVALWGRNGSGKTTLLHTVAGLLACDEGFISVGGRDLDRPGTRSFVPPEHRRVALVFQEARLFAHLDALANVAFGLRAAGIHRQVAHTRGLALLERMDLKDLAHRTPGELSGGQARRVALARALATDPEVLLLDEPGASLDAQTRTRMHDELSAYLAEFRGVTLVVTHEADEAERLTSRVVSLDGGTISG